MRIRKPASPRAALAVAVGLLLVGAGVAYVTTRNDEGMAASLREARAVAAEFGTPSLTRLAERRDMYLLYAEGSIFLGGGPGEKVIGRGIFERFEADETASVDRLVEEFERAIHQISALSGVEVSTRRTAGDISLWTPTDRRVSVSVNLRKSANYEIDVAIQVKKAGA